MTQQAMYQPHRRSSMQHGMVAGRMLSCIAVVGLLVGMVPILGCPGGDSGGAEEVVCACDDITVPLSHTTIRALEGQTFAFSSGAALSAALAHQPLTVTFTHTTAATPHFTVTAPNTPGTDGHPARVTGITTFGSCLFTVTTSTFPLLLSVPPAGAPPVSGPQVGETIRVIPCQLSVATTLEILNGRTTDGRILLQLGLIPSAPLPAHTTVDLQTGTVTVNNVPIGNLALTITVGL